MAASFPRHMVHVMQASQESRETERPVATEAPLLVSVPEAARLLGVGTTFAWTMVHRGELPVVKLGRRVLVSRAALERLVGIDERETSV